MNPVPPRVCSDEVSELLAQWVEHRELGNDVSVDVLCCDTPHLLPLVSSLVARLKRSDWLFDESAEALPEPGDDSLGEDLLGLAASLSARDLLQRTVAIQALPAEERTDLAKRFRDSHGAPLARLLIDRDVVTPFQLRHLCCDRGRDLVLNDYLLIELIGQGGMGRVYKARHRTMGRVVALKVLDSRTLGASAAAPRFRREIAAAARLNHPQIVRAYDAGESRGRPYLVMEHVEGTDLATLVEQSGPLPIGRAIDCILQAARALEYAHGEGIVHRDVKPSNLLLDSEGGVKVLDLGLARVADLVAEQSRLDAGSLTGSGQVMGTLDYLAPEQARDSRQADQRSDIYSLGCTLYALLHGRPMYDAESLASRLLAHQSAPVPPLRAERRDVPRWLETVFRHMVAKRPEDRFESMEQVVAALKGGGTAWTRPARASTHLPKRQGAGAALALVAAALLVSGAALGPRWERPGGEEQPLQVPVAAAPAQRLVSPAPNRPSPAVAMAPFDPEQARAHQEAWAAHLGVPVAYENSLGMTFRLIPPGEFTMGTPVDEAQVLAAKASSLRRDEHLLEAPARRVRLTQAFYLAECEVTQQQYQQIMDANPSHFSAAGRGADRVAELDTGLHPVESISWVDAAQFCNDLGRREGRPTYYYSVNGLTRTHEREPIGYRLPTEAEWEFACRGGSEGPYGFVGPDSLLEQYATFSENAGGRTHPVATRLPNAFGLYDMNGSVSEWCYDGYGPYERLATTDPSGPADVTRSHRGGCWANSPVHCRSATRSAHTMRFSSRHLGVRVLLPVEAVQRELQRS